MLLFWKNLPIKYQLLTKFSIITIIIETIIGLIITVKKKKKLIIKSYKKIK